jgi:hypothetical protein
MLVHMEEVMEANELVGRFVDWVEQNGLDVAETLRILNAGEAQGDDDEHVVMPRFTVTAS